jgi:hypothetical protein
MTDERPALADELRRVELDEIATAEGIEDPGRFANKAELRTAILVGRGEPPPESFDPITLAPDVTIEYTDAAGDQVTITTGSSGKVTPSNAAEAAILASHAVGTDAGEASAAANEESA